MVKSAFGRGKEHFSGVWSQRSNCRFKNKLLCVAIDTLEEVLVLQEGRRRREASRPFDSSTAQARPIPLKATRGVRCAAGTEGTRRRGRRAALRFVLPSQRQPRLGFSGSSRRGGEGRGCCSWAPTCTLHFGAHSHARQPEPGAPGVGVWALGQKDGLARGLCSPLSPRSKQRRDGLTCELSRAEPEQRLLTCPAPIAGPARADPSVQGSDLFPSVCPSLCPSVRGGQNFPQS